MEAGRIMGRALVLSAAVAAGGCATVMRGSTESFAVETEPDGALVELMATGQSCETPCVLEVPRRGDLTVFLSKDGYRSRMVVVESVVDKGGVGWGLGGNLLLGGVVGGVADAASGAMRAHHPNPLKVELEREPEAGQ